MPGQGPSDLAALAARLAGCLLALGAAGATAGAQVPPFKPAVQSEVRLDALAGPPAGVQMGVGANIPMGYYVRFAADVAGGASWRDGATVASGRADLVARYLLDPFKEFKWGPYGGAGFSALWERGASWRGALLLLLGVEGPARPGWRTSVELGLGGGARLGVVLRRARSNGR
jgi:hypothetical protein